MGRNTEGAKDTRKGYDVGFPRETLRKGTVGCFGDRRVGGNVGVSQSKTRRTRDGGQERNARRTHHGGTESHMGTIRRFETRIQMGTNLRGANQ